LSDNHRSYSNGPDDVWFRKQLESTIHAEKILPAATLTHDGMFHNFQGTLPFDDLDLLLLNILSGDTQCIEPKHHETFHFDGIDYTQLLREHRVMENQFYCGRNYFATIALQLNDSVHSPC
jgi:hypothetical protein